MASDTGGLGLSARFLGVERLVKKLAFQRLMGEPKRRFAKKFAEEVLDHAKTNLEPHNYSLDLSDSGHVDSNSSGSRVMFDDPAGVFLEFGTRPREQMPNIDSITPWALDHGWDPWALGKVIQAYGTEAHPFLQPAVDEAISGLGPAMAVFAADVEITAALT